MRKLKSYSFAMAMLILNMIPCCNSCCCLVGLPIGIWGLTVLMKPEVKRAFQS
jgi:ABC-type proline/glycine betaine transport system permease subunit